MTDKSVMRKCKHGQANKTRIWFIWNGMKSRCYSTGSVNYKNYGGRGIKVCDRWKDSFANFYADMGDPPDQHSLDRIDNEGDYSPENCRWATRAEQCRNRRTNVFVVLNGERMCLEDAAIRTGIHKDTIRCRAKKGIPIDLPPMDRSKRKKGYAASIKEPK